MNRAIQKCTHLNPHKITKKQNNDATTLPNEDNKHESIQHEQQNNTTIANNIDPLQICIFGERENRWLELEGHGRNKCGRRNPLHRDGYSHPNDPNIQIYPGRRYRTPWIEQIGLNWLDKSPKTTAELNSEKLALGEF